MAFWEASWVFRCDGADEGGSARAETQQNLANSVLKKQLGFQVFSKSSILKLFERQRAWKDLDMRARRRAHVARMVLFDTYSCNGRTLDQRECTAW